MPRANFSSPRLVRLLSATAAASAASPTPKQDFAARLGQWLPVSAAIQLHAVLEGSPAGVLTVNTDTDKSIADELARTRTVLANAIVKSCSADAETSRLRFPAPQPAPLADIAALYAPFQRFHLAHQREMEQRLAPLRAAAREALAKASPALKQLADIDDIFEATLGERQRSLLAAVPALLEQRFAQLLAAHRQGLGDGAEDDTAQWLQGGGWLARYRDELRQLLLAELDLRLQPIMGLADALSTALN